MSMTAQGGEDNEYDNTGRWGQYREVGTMSMTTQGGGDNEPDKSGRWGQ